MGLQQQEQQHGHLHRARAKLHNGLAKLSSADRRTLPPRAPSRSSLRPSGRRHLRTLSLSRAATDRTFELVGGPWHAVGSHIGLRPFARVPEPGMEAGLGRSRARAALGREARVGSLCSAAMAPGMARPVSPCQYVLTCRELSSDRTSPCLSAGAAALFTRAGLGSSAARSRQRSTPSRARDGRRGAPSCCLHLHSCCVLRADCPPKEGIIGGA